MLMQKNVNIHCTHYCQTLPLHYIPQIFGIICMFFPDYKRIKFDSTMYDRQILLKKTFKLCISFTTRKTKIWYSQDCKSHICSFTTTKLLTLSKKNPQTFIFMHVQKTRVSKWSKSKNRPLENVWVATQWAATEKYRKYDLIIHCVHVLL